MMATCGDDVKPVVIVSPRADECEACDEHEVDSYCHQCQQWFCKRCTKAHAKVTVTKNHTFTSLVERTEEVKNQIKLQIQSLQAKTEELKSAAAQNVKLMTEIEAAHTQTKLTSEQLRADLHADVDKYFEALNKCVDGICQDEMNTVTQLKRDKEIETCRELKRDLDELLKQHDIRMLAKAEESVSKAQELMNSLDDVAVDVPRVNLKRNSNWSLEGAVNPRLQHEVTRRKKKRLDIGTTPGLTLLAAAQKLWMRRAKVKLPPIVNSLRVINQQLWCFCDEGGIVVLDPSDLKQLRTIPAGDMGDIRDVAEIRDGDVVIAANNGLFHVQLNGNLQCRIHSGCFSSVAVHKNKVYAATVHDAVCVYKHTGSWIKVHSFSVDLDGCITLSVKNNQIKCCSESDHKMAVYSLSGELLHTFSTKTWRIYTRLFRNGPQICADDDDGSVLIAYYRNDVLQVMSEQGKLSLLLLQPRVSGPVSAVLINNQLYLLQSDTSGKVTLQIYT